MLHIVEKYKNKCIGLLLSVYLDIISAHRFASSEQLGGSKENLGTLSLILIFSSKYRVRHLIL